MNEHQGKRVVYVVIVASFVIPVLVMFWNAEIGALALVVGLFVMFRSIHLLRSMHDENADAQEQTLYKKQNSANVIYVQLTDDNGNDLPADVAQAKLAAAQRAAGPRDTVLGVRQAPITS